eukprot:gene33724-43425_t
MTDPGELGRLEEWKQIVGPKPDAEEWQEEQHHCQHAYIVTLGSVTLGSVTLGSATLGSVTLGSVTLGSMTLGNVTLGNGGVHVWRMRGGGAELPAGPGDVHEPVAGSASAHRRDLSRPQGSMGVNRGRWESIGVGGSRYGFVGVDRGRWMPIQ